MSCHTYVQYVSHEEPITFNREKIFCSANDSGEIEYPHGKCIEPCLTPLLSPKNGTPDPNIQAETRKLSEENVRESLRIARQPETRLCLSGLL